MNMMSEVLQTNIFFFVTAVAVVVLTIFVGVALFYFIQILRNIRDISNKVRRGGDVLGKDLSALRKTVKEEGIKSKNIIDFFSKRFAPLRQKKVTKKKSSEAK